MKLTVLGNCGPFPAPGGACSGYLLTSESANTRLIIDFGTGTLSRFQKFADIRDISAIVLSHLHYDHMSDMLPLKYLLQFNKLIKNIPVLAPDEPAGVCSLLSDAQLDIMTPRDMTIGEMKLFFAPSTHPVPGYSLRVECDGKIFVYTGDTNLNPMLPLFIDGCDMLLADAGVPKAQWTERSPHLSPDKCGELARSARAKELLLTHIRPGCPVGELLDEARAEFPEARIAKPGADYYI